MTYYNRKMLRAALTCVLIVLLAIILWVLYGCAPVAMQAMREDGFNKQWLAFDSIKGEKFEQAEVNLSLRVVVVHDRQQIEKESEIPGAGGAYFQYQKMLMIPGKMVKGKIIIPDAVLGHEVGHALQRQDPRERFHDPDELKQLGY